MSRSWPVALSVAGSDPSGGAGIQADLKTFAALEVYGAAAISAITVQNTRACTLVEPVAADLVRCQMLAVLEDLPVAVIKIGMLAGAGQVDAVASVLSDWPATPVVLDPVLRASTGTSLLDDAGRDALGLRLIPRADVVTPNHSEARALVAGAGSGEAASRRMLAMGARAVLLTGGDAGEDPIEDVLVTADGVQRLRHPRHGEGSPHGTGCTLAAAVAAGLARGLEVPQAVTRAVSYTGQAVAGAWPLGRGREPVHHFHDTWRDPS